MKPSPARWPPPRVRSAFAMNSPGGIQHGGAFLDSLPDAGPPAHALAAGIVPSPAGFNGARTPTISGPNDGFTWA